MGIQETGNATTGRLEKHAAAAEPAPERTHECICWQCGNGIARAAAVPEPAAQQESVEDAELQLIQERDDAEEWADKLAYAIAPMEEIGEHTSMNNPWANALEIACARQAEPAPTPSRQKFRVRLDDGKRYDKEVEMYSHDHCCICGKPLVANQKKNQLLCIRSKGFSETLVIRGIEDIQFPADFDHQQEGGVLEVFAVPIGSDCLKKHPEYQPAVIRAEASSLGAKEKWPNYRDSCTHTPQCSGVVECERKLAERGDSK